MLAADAASTATPPTRARPRRSAMRRRELIWGIGFLLPWILGFFMFQLLPIVMTIFLSFTEST